MTPRPFKSLDQERKERIISQVEKLENERNIGSKKVGELMRGGSKEEARQLQAELKHKSEQIKELSEERKQG